MIMINSYDQLQEVSIFPGLHKPLVLVYFKMIRKFTTKYTFSPENDSIKGYWHFFNVNTTLPTFRSRSIK